VKTVLVEKFNIHKIIGYDHRFGRNRTVDDLIDFGIKYGLK
jgi:FAD synthase